jgi:hypothetical protein
LANLANKQPLDLKDQVMALKTSRARRGTKALVRAFLDAAETISADRRSAVVKDALASIRDELKANREKLKAAAATNKPNPRTSVRPTKVKRISSRKAKAA